MKNYKQKFLVAVLTVMTMVGVADASIAKNPAYAQSVDTKALASSQKLLKAVDDVHKVETVEEKEAAAKEAMAKLKAAREAAAKKAAEEAKAAKAKAKALAASYKETYRRNGTSFYKYVAPETSGYVKYHIM